MPTEPVLSELLERGSPLGGDPGYEKVLVITINHSYAGFFAYVTFVINQLIYAEKHGLLPVVHFGARSADGPNAFYDPAVGENTWDYYFEPVAGWRYDEIRTLVDSSESPLSESDLIRLSREELWYLHREDPDSVYNYPYGYYQHLEGESRDWYREQRLKASRVIDKYIRIKPEILGLLDTWTSDNFTGERVLGLHMRGTDKGGAGPVQPHLSRVMTPDKYYPLIERDTQEHGEGRIFLATDQRQFVELLRQRYGDRVLALEAIRSDSSINPFQVSDSKNYIKGREVLLDCLILSRCDFLLKCTSAVGEYAMYFNPELECIDVNHLKQAPTFEDSLAVSWNRAKSLSWRGEPQGLRDRVRQLTSGPIRFFATEAIEQRRHSTNSLWRGLVIAKDAAGSLATRGGLPMDVVRYRASVAKRRKGSPPFDPGNASFHKVLEIRIDEPGDRELFDQVLAVLEQLHFAEAHRLEPVVRLDQPNHRYREPGAGANVWEYFFEPVSPRTAEELEAMPARELTSLGPIEQRCVALGAGNHEADPPERLDAEGRLWFDRRRAMGADLVRRLVKPASELREAADRFWKAEFAEVEHVLGAHLASGHDHPVPPPGRNIDVLPGAFMPHFEAYLERRPEGRILIAASDPTLADAVKTRFGDRVVYRERSGPARGRAGGEDAVVDALLLARCSALLHGGRALGEVASFFSPQLPVIDLSYPASPDALVGLEGG
ncbi:MAG: hypothetical protein AAGK22_04935 [Acidobacteriota bacterium]